MFSCTYHTKHLCHAPLHHVLVYLAYFNIYAALHQVLLYLAYLTFFAALNHVPLFLTYSTCMLRYMFSCA